MEAIRLADGVEITDEVFRKARSVAMKAHKEKVYTSEKLRNSSGIIFSFPGSWEVKEWFSKGPFGNTKRDHPVLFPSLKYLGLDEIATVNEAFLGRFKEVLNEPRFKEEVEEAARQRKQVLFTGHSSGGAIAILATVWFLEEYIRTDRNKVAPLCVTFGSPLVGDRIMSHALGRENWSRFFVNIVNRYDIVPRISLAPLSLLERHLQQALNYFNPKHPSHKKELPSEVRDFYESVVKYASSVASHAACKIMGSTNGLLETLCGFIEMSPYRPFGTYIFCTGNTRPVVISNPDAILQVLFYSSQLNSANELREIAERSLKDHLNYKDKAQESLQWQNAIVLDQELLEALPLSPGVANVNSTVSEALNDLGLSPKARLCLRAAAEFEKQKIKNQNTIDEKKTEIKNGIKKLEDYKSRCELRNICYYDAFKASDNEDDFQANVARLELAGIWDELVELLKRLELPDRFEVQEDWIDLGTSYRRIAEPLDIANYYRHLKNEDTGPYMGKGRPKRYKCTQKWREHDLRRPIDFSGSCFWAEVEELCRGTGSPGNKERLLNLYKHLEGWIQDGELGRDVCFGNSTFQRLLESNGLRA